MHCVRAIPDFLWTMTWWLLFPLAILAATSTKLSAIECRWTDHPPVIDGRADDAAWQQAEPVETTVKCQALTPFFPNVCYVRGLSQFQLFELPGEFRS